MLERIVRRDVAHDVRKCIDAGMQVERDDVAGSTVTKLLLNGSDGFESLSERFNMAYIRHDDISVLLNTDIGSIDKHLLQTGDVCTLLGTDDNRV